MNQPDSVSHVDPLHCDFGQLLWINLFFFTGCKCRLQCLLYGFRLSGHEIRSINHVTNLLFLLPNYKSAYTIPLGDARSCPLTRVERGEPPPLSGLLSSSWDGVVLIEWVYRPFLVTGGRARQRVL